MKKLLAIILALALVFALAACGGDSKDDNSGNAANPVIVEYINKNENDLLSGMESAFATSSGMTCRSSIDVIGDGFVITIKINELDNVDSEIKETLKTAYAAMQPSFDAMLPSIQAEVPEIEYFAIKVCEKDGDLLAEIVAGNR